MKTFFGISFAILALIIYGSFRDENKADRISEANKFFLAFLFVLILAIGCLFF